MLLWPPLLWASLSPSPGADLDLELIWTWSGADLDLELSWTWSGADLEPIFLCFVSKYLKAEALMLMYGKL